MKCISMWNPWAMWVTLEWKPVETRFHSYFKSLVGQRIGIHAAMKWDREWERLAGPYLTEEQEYLTTINYREWKALGGHVISTVFVERFESSLAPGDSKAALIDCSHGDRTGLFLKDIVRIMPPIRWQGSQGIFDVPENLFKRIEL